jgi:hypothetical protein
MNFRQLQLYLFLKVRYISFIRLPLLVHCPHPLISHLPNKLFLCRGQLVLHNNLLISQRTLLSLDVDIKFLSHFVLTDDSSRFNPSFPRQCQLLLDLLIDIISHLLAICNHLICFCSHHLVFFTLQEPLTLSYTVINSFELLAVVHPTLEFDLVPQFMKFFLKFAVFVKFPLRERFKILSGCHCGYLIKL